MTFFTLIVPINMVSPADAINKIMPVGDSITNGSASGVIPDNSAYYVSYRKALWDKLLAAGYEIDFVGNRNSGSEIFGASEPADHAGQPGWADDQIVNGKPLVEPDADYLAIWLADYQPQIVLLHIGTNYLDPSPDDVEAILDVIDAFSPNVWVVLARIINRACCAEAPLCPVECQQTMDFNDNVEDMALDRINNPSIPAIPDKIVIVDMEAGADIDYRVQPVGDMWNDLHPFVPGYAKMADLWFSGLMQIMPQADAGPDQIVNASAPVTLDAGGSFDPEGGDLSYKWVQTTGTPVVDLLPDDQAAMPTFGTPEVVKPDGELLIFKVTVFDPDGLESTDSISVTVLNCPGDFDLDNDVDALDLGEYVGGRGGLNLNGFVADFGKVNCQ